MKKIIVCGCSWMSPDHNPTYAGDQPYKGTHFSELLAEKLGYELVVYAKPGSSNGGICVQIEEAIRSKPDLIIFGQSVSDRVELRITEHIEHMVPWNNLDARDAEVKLSELLGEHAVNPTLMSDNLGSMLYDPKHQPEYANHFLHTSAKWFRKHISQYGVDITQNHSNDMAEAVKDWFMHLYSPRMKNQIDMWTLYAVEHKLHLSGIPALKVIDLLHYDTPWYPCITKGYGPGDGYVSPTHDHGSYHTTLEAQHDILRDIEVALEHKYNNEI